MKIVNVTRETLLAASGVLAYSFWSRLRGLLFTDCLPAGRGLVIKPCSSIHTVGMAYSIDVLFVDHRHIVIRGLAALEPYRMARCPGSAYVIELPAGTLAATGTQVGDKVKITG